MELIVTVNQLFSQKEIKTRMCKIVQFPFIRIIIAIAFVYLVTVLRNVFSLLVLDKLDNINMEIVSYFEVIISISLTFILYRLYTKKIENRNAVELSTIKWYKELATGIGIGGGLVIFITIILVIFGFYRIEGFNSPSVLFSRIFKYGMGSFIEEMIFTIIIFRLVEEFVGTIASMIAISLLFGFMHLGNDNASILSSFYIAASHIIILAPFILTRRIWLVWGVHFSWNYFQTAVLGMNNSGMAHKGYINPIINGPEWATGGSFGIEASYISIILSISVGVFIFWHAIKQGQLVKAAWKRN